MTNAKSAVRAALLELIEADGKMTKAPWETRSNLPYSSDGIVIFSGRFEENETVGRWPNSKYGRVQENVAGICLARNLAPGMARIILKMLDEPDCFKCHGMGEIDEFPDLKFENHQIVPCPRCTARWQEWAILLGLK